MMRTVSLIFFLIEFRKYETLELLNHFTKINPPCQMKNSVFITLSGRSRVRCGGLCDSNSFGRCGRFIWDQDSRTCMLHSSTIFPGTSSYTVTTGSGWSTFSKTRKGNCGLRQDRGFLQVLLFLPPYKLTVRHDITEILLKMILSNKTLTLS